MKDPLVLYTPDNRRIVDFNPDANTCPFLDSNGTSYGWHELHKAEVIEVYVAGVVYERDIDGKKLRAVMEVTSDVTPDFYTVYTVSNTDTPTAAVSDHKKVDKAIMAGAKLASDLGLQLKLRVKL